MRGTSFPFFDEVEGSSQMRSRLRHHIYAEQVALTLLVEQVGLTLFVEQVAITLFVDQVALRIK